MIKIGIDPGKTTGIAILLDVKIVLLITTDFWGAYELVINYSKDIEIHIEDTNDLPVLHGNHHNPKVKGAIGRRVGSVCREASLLIQRFRSLGYNVVVHKNKKYSKLDAKTFNRLTGWKGKSNQHERDACMLCFRL